MRKYLIFISTLILYSVIYAQSYNTDSNYLGQYIKRMYLNEPFQGAKIISDIDNCYLACIVVENTLPNESVMQRKAEVKAMRYANEFLNGAQVTSESIVYTKKNSNGYSYEEIEDYIESRSVGYIQQMQILSTFSNDAGKRVYIFSKELPMPKKRKK